MITDKRKAIEAMKSKFPDAKAANEIWENLSSDLQRDMDVRKVYFDIIAYVPEEDKELMAGIIDFSDETLEESNKYWDETYGNKGR